MDQFAQVRSHARIREKGMDFFHVEMNSLSAIPPSNNIYDARKEYRPVQYFEILHA